MQYTELGFFITHYAFMPVLYIITNIMNTCTYWIPPQKVQYLFCWASYAAK